jgi:glutamate-ammonia-ligase adenylyltransferase
MMDIEFIAQTMQLLHAHAQPQILDTNTIAGLDRLANADLLNPADAAMLRDAAGLEQALTQTLRIALDETLKAEEATPALKGLLARAGGAADFAALEQRLRASQSAVRDFFTRLVGEA